MYLFWALKAIGQKMGGLGHCLASVLPTLGQVWDVIVRPPIQDRRRQKLQKCSKQRACQCCFCNFCRLLSRIAVSSCGEGHVDDSFAFSAHRFVELFVPFSLRAPIIHAWPAAWSVSPSGRQAYQTLKRLRTDPIRSDSDWIESLLIFLWSHS